MIFVKLIYEVRVFRIGKKITWLLFSRTRLNNYCELFNLHIHLTKNIQKSHVNQVYIRF